MAPTTMRAVAIKGGTGPATSLYVAEDAPVPEPGPGEALVRVAAFGLNRMDLLQREGKYPVPAGVSQTLGVEFSGVVVRLGPPRDSSSSSSNNNNNPSPSSDPPLAPGEAVFGLAYGGAYAEYVAVSAAMLLRKPAHLGWVRAAAVPEAWMTAAQALHLVGEMAPGKRVLWHAGASGVSIAGAQLSRAAGAAAVYATAGSPAKCDFAERELRVDRAFDYRARPAWDQDLLEATGGKGVDVIVDFVGAPYFARNLRAAALDARWVVLGLMGGSLVPPPEEGKGKGEPVDISAILRKRVRIEGSTLRSRDEAYQSRLRDRLAEYVPLFETGELRVFVDTTLSMDDVVRAHQLMESNQTTGKIVCEVPGFSEVV